MSIKNPPQIGLIRRAICFLRELTDTFMALVMLQIARMH
jgi:hypothetical protein